MRHIRRRCLLPDIVALHIANDAHPRRLIVHRGAVLLRLIQVLAIRAAPANHIVVIVALRSHTCCVWLLPGLAIVSYYSCSVWQFPRQFEHVSCSFTSRLGFSTRVRLLDHVLELLSSLGQISLVPNASLRELACHHIDTVLEALLEDFMRCTEIVRCHPCFFCERSYTL